MSFICQHTGEVVGPRIKQNLVVVQKREKTYQKPIKRFDKIIRWETVRGWEIAKELKVGPQGYQDLTGKEPAYINKPAQKSVYQKENTKPAEPWRKRNNRRDNNYQMKRPVIEVVNKKK